MFLLRPSFALLVILSIAVPSALALPNDREQAIHITADQAMRDEKKGLTTYSGNVVFTQGSLKINADTITIFQTEDGHDKVIAKGKPARLQQRQELGEELMKANADTIEYFRDEDRIHLQPNAKIEQDGSIVSGKTIDYYITEQLVKVGSDQSQENSRVQVVIPPSAIEKNEDKSGDSKRK